jgi:hypothetical protein
VAARVRARVAAAVGATAVVAPAAKATAGVTALKLGGLLVVLGVVAGAFLVLPRTERALAPHVTATSSELDEPRGSVAVSVAESEAPAAPALHSSRPVTTRASLAREVELIDRAMLALRAGTPAAALEAIATFERETQHRGQMAEDAAAIEIEAHCGLDQDVKAKLAAFDRAYPSSAQRARLQQACR